MRCREIRKVGGARYGRWVIWAFVLDLLDGAAACTTNIREFIDKCSCAQVEVGTAVENISQECSLRQCRSESGPPSGAYEYRWALCISRMGLLGSERSRNTWRKGLGLFQINFLSEQLNLDFLQILSIYCAS